MKLLFLAPYPPFPPRGGGQQRIYQFIRHLARDHEVWLLTFSPTDDATAALDPLRQICHVEPVPLPQHTLERRVRTLIGSSLPDMALRGRSTAFAVALDRLLRAVPFDVVQAESIEMAQYGGRDHGPLWVYDAFNAEYLLQQRAFRTDLRTLHTLPLAGYSLIQWQKLRRYETQLGQRFNGALAVSPNDMAILQRLTGDLRWGVVPNGVDTAYFRRDRALVGDGKHHPYVLFTGTLDFRPNIDAVTWFVNAVLPRVRSDNPDVRFVVVGRNPVPAVRELGSQRGVEIVGEVDDVRSWFNGASAYVVPMRIGGGVRLKLLEALSMEQAVIATRMGVEGVEGLLDGTHALLADHPDAFAAQIRTVLHDRARAQQLGAAGRALVVERYDWSSIVPRMLALWDEWRSHGTNAPPSRG